MMRQKVYPDELDLEIATATEGAPTPVLHEESLRKAGDLLATASGLCSDPGPDPVGSIRVAVALAIEALRTIYQTNK